MKWRALLSVSVFLVTVAPPVHAEAPLVRPRGNVSEIEPNVKEHPDLIVLRRQMAQHPELPPIEFWLAVARCETNLHWDRGIDWGPNARSYVRGGLGIAWSKKPPHSTWGGYGGLRFGKTPAHASKWAQMVVANRIGFLGWQTNEYLTWQDREAGRKFYRPAVGFHQGWGGVCYTTWMKENRP